jgi:hypothetical protein
MIVAGFQSIVFYTFSKMFAYSQGLYPEDEKVKSYINAFNLEKGLIAALLLLIAGFTLAIHSVIVWNEAGFGNLDPNIMLRKVIPASTLLILGVQMLFYSFFFSMLQIKQSKS